MDGPGSQVVSIDICGVDVDSIPQTKPVGELVDLYKTTTFVEDFVVRAADIPSVETYEDVAVEAIKSSVRLLLYDAYRLHQPKARVDLKIRGDGMASNDSVGVGGGAGEGAPGTNSKAGRVKGQLVEDEEKAVGRVALDTWIAYFSKESGGPGLLLVMVLITLLAQLTEIAFNWWLSKWTDAFVAAPVGDDVDDGARIGTYSLTLYQYSMIYGLLGLGVVLTALTRAMIFAHQAGLASKGLFKSLLSGTFGASMAFFDTTPIGRILNRFSRDTTAIDCLFFIIIFQFLTNNFFSIFFRINAITHCNIELMHLKRFFMAI